MDRRAKEPQKPFLAERRNNIDTSRLWIPWLNVLAGLWLIASVFVFYLPDPAASFYSVITGTVIVITGISIWVTGYFYRAMIWERLSWFNVFLGLWTVAMAFIFRLPLTPALDLVITGIFVAVVAVVNWILNWEFCRACRIQR